ncbi:LPS-assembly protein LptD [Flavobacterium rakeshii]|uniref:LPS-assembly protein LptD n=2 Tax=Flavobacterium rakeshii TaxID=1038845 RepID=A0A6N8HDQ4_9FLAO|nr:LPS-assembly protein LptD [Flavobacterium rakeshii]
MRTNLFHIVLSAIFLTIMSWNSHAQEIRKEGKEIPAENKETTEIAEPKPNDTLEVSLQEPVKKVENDTNKKNGGINNIIKRKASDYEGYDMRTNIGTLYNNAEIEYEDMLLKAGIIKYNKATNEVFAGRIKDSTGTYSQYPYFKQGGQEIEADSIHFNTITKKARVWNTRTDQGEFRVKGEITKKENDSTYYIKNAHFTTSKDIENPDYEFRTAKIKLVPNKKVVVGTTVMWIQDVPTPIVLPFGYFPMTKDAESGFIVPTFGDNNNQGYFLQNGGYYFAISDYMDLAVTGDYYTNGSYGLRGQSNYAKRYKFRGNVNVRFENIVQSERGFPDYSRARQYNIQWSHSQDSKANPNSRFSASVNLGSSQYFRQSLNTVNVGSSLNNTLSSSISYSKTFQTVPQVNMSLTARHSQNTNTESITMSLPTLQASVDRIFPFASADEPKKGFIKNINLQYNLRGENSVNTTDSLFFKPQMFKDMRTGLQHSIPISTNFKIFKYFSVSTGTNFQETWVLNTINRQYNPTSGKVETTDLKGFDAYRTYNFTSSIGTTIYGTFNFNPDGKIQAIRHVMRPSVSYSYTPSFDQYYDTYNTDATQNENYEKYYSRFEGGLFGAPGRNISNSIGLGLNNTFEAKMRNDDESSDEPKKVMLLNNLNFTTNYNIAADSLAWSPLRITGGTALFNQKLNVNFGASLDPYALDNSGTRIDTYNINNGGSLFRLTNANLTLGYSFTSRGDSGSKKNSDNQTARNGGREDDLFGSGTDMSDQRQSMFNEDDEDKPDKAGGTFFNAVIPFDLRLAYSLNYNNARRQKEITGNSLMVSGNIDITPKWKMGFSTGYDFVNNGITFTQLRFERDLSSWRMDFNWVPNGYNKYWSFFIGIKSSVLSDIKWDKRQVPDRTVGN